MIPRCCINSNGQWFKWYNLRQLTLCVYWLLGYSTNISITRHRSLAISSNPWLHAFICRNTVLIVALPNYRVNFAHSSFLERVPKNLLSTIVEASLLHIVLFILSITFSLQRFFYHITGYSAKCWASPTRSIAKTILDTNLVKYLEIS